VTQLTVVASSIVVSNGVWTAYSVGVLDVPYTGLTNQVLATNYVTVQMLQVNNTTNVLEQLVRVDCVWPFYYWNKQTAYYTNTVCTLLAPDNRDPSTL
jgi:hypothetical protein